MAFGLDAGEAIERAALHTQPRTAAMWQGIPVVVVVLLGGFTVNFLWCLFLNFKNRTVGDYAKTGAPRCWPTCSLPAPPASSGTRNSPC